MSINVILIDDERPALRMLEALLKKYEDINIIGSFTNPMEAIENIKRLLPQVVFLDINMPQLRGIDAASRILDASPDTDIVFVTAYDQYALDAFELHAIDYILKPINPERLDKTIRRVMKKQSVEPKIGFKKLQIKCLGSFEVKWEGEEEPVKWRSEKTKELFAFLIQNNERSFSKEEIINELWPEENPEKAIRQLYNGIYYIRKTLDRYGIDSNLININFEYNLKLGSVDCDVKRFYELSAEKNYGDVKALEEMETIYSGRYFEHEDYSWADLKREEIDKICINCFIKLSGLYLNGSQYEKTEKILLRAYGIEPYEESITELLLKLYIIIKSKSKGVQHFHAYADLVKDELGIRPSESIIRLYQQIKLL